MHCYEDAEAEPLRRSLDQVEGISCFEWCSGHGTEPFRIRFTAKQVRDLAPILCCIPYKWRIEVEIQFDGNITFLLEGPPTTEDTAKPAAIAGYTRHIRANRHRK